MKIIYEKSIIEKMEDALIEARRDGKKIEKIILSKSERAELMPILNSRSWFGTNITYTIGMQDDMDIICMYDRVLVEGER